MEERSGRRRPSVRPLLIAIVTFFVAGFAISYIGFKIVQKSSEFPMSMPLPPFMKKGLVLVPMNGLKMTKLAASGIGDVTDLRSASGGLLLAGTLGAATVDAGGTLKPLDVHFPPLLSEARILPPGKDGDITFLVRSYAGIARIAPQGEAVWLSRHSAASLAIGSFDDKGPARIAAGYSGSDGIVLTDLDGKRIWRSDAANPWDMAFAPVNDAGHRRLVSSSAGGTLFVRGEDGKASNYETQSYLHTLAPIRWPGASGKPALIANSKGGLVVIDFHGKTLALLDSPRPMEPSEGVLVSSRAAQSIVLKADDKIDRDVASAAFVSLQENEPPYLAVSVDLSPYERSTLNLYDAKGNLRYCEFLEQRAGPLLAAPMPGRPGLERLLVGGDGQVLSYSF